ncbi:hypothetical protein ACROYT_G010906, partial [Oculina patagonica]
MSSKCISCNKPVRPRQQGLQCDGCLRWQHRTCGTGVTLADYRAAVRSEASIDWRCEPCMVESSPVPVHESTPVDFVANSVLESSDESAVPDSVADESAVPDSVADNESAI